MKNPRLTLSFLRVSDSKLESDAQFIVTSMTDNANFPTPQPAITVVATAVNEYMQARAEAQSKDKTKVAIKNSKRQALDAVLKTLCNYVMLTADGDESKLVSSGFKLAKEPTTAPPLPNPENFTVSSGPNSGEIITSVDRVPGARSYIHECLKDPLTEDGDWESITTTDREYTFTGLTSGIRYWLRMAAVGVGGQIIYTSTISRIAL